MSQYNIDLASIALYVFRLFFAGLIYYLHRENKREGYPLVSETSGPRTVIVGFPAPPPAKTYLLHDGTSVRVADGRPDTREIKAAPVAPWPGAPLEPTGDPMVDGVGPASYAERADHPDMTYEGEPKIVPLSVAHDYYIESRDPDPRGMTVKGADGYVAGTVKDVWVDKSEYIIRYYEVAIADGSVLLPAAMSRVDGMRREIRVAAVYAEHFAKAPRLKNPQQVTFLEEDKICGFFGGGYLYAHPSRVEPLL